MNISVTSPHCQHTESFTNSLHMTYAKDLHGEELDIECTHTTNSDQIDQDNESRETWNCILCAESLIIALLLLMTILLICLLVNDLTT